MFAYLSAAGVIAAALIAPPGAAAITALASIEPDIPDDVLPEPTRDNREPQGNWYLADNPDQLHDPIAPPYPPAHDDECEMFTLVGT